MAIQDLYDLVCMFTSRRQITHLPIALAHHGQAGNRFDVATLDVAAAVADRGLEPIEG